MKEFVPYPLGTTEVPIDISHVFADEKPAGKHGFLQVKGDHFEFEDGAKAKFWGACINGQANFPEHDQAERMAKRMAKFGINLVRLHQTDAEYAAPNIFQFTKGRFIENTRSFDPESMERMDYLIHCFRKEGIYIYMDFLTARSYREGDGVVNSHKLYSAGRPYLMTDRRLIELQKEFNQHLMEHKNPYTGLAYKDDPAIVMIDIVNECTLFHKWPAVEPYESDFREDFRQWCKAEGIEKDVDAVTLFGNDIDPDLVRYKILRESGYYREMRNHLLSLGVKCPITGSNYIVHSGLFAANSEMDFRDNHAYFHRFFEDTGTTWGIDYKKMENFSLTERGDCGFSKLFHMRSFDKPFVCSEWNMTWPNKYRAEGPLMYAAVGAFQGMDGIAIHTYSYNKEQKNGQLLGKEVVADGLAGVPYREGIFSCWNDPAMMGLFYHSALILRRGDVAEANKKIAVVADPTRGLERAEFLKDAEKPFNWYLDKRFDRMAPCYYVTPEMSKLGTCLEVPEGVDQVFTEPQWPIDPKVCEVRSDTGEMYRNWEKNYGWIDTERTKAFYGFLKKNGALSVTDLEMECENEFAVVAMSSLSEEKLSKSKNILLTTVGRVENKNAKFDGDVMLEWGEPITMAEVIRGTIRLKTEIPNMKVFSITCDGMVQATIPSTYEDGVLSFKLGEKFAGVHYLIQAI